MKRILVLWAEPSSANFGVRVLAEGAEAVARRILGADVQVEHHDFPSWTLGAQVHRKSVVFDRLGIDRTWRKSLRSYDFVLDTGAGDSLTDIYGLERLVVMTEVQKAVLRAGLPLMLLPQTVGPFRTRTGKALARPTIRRATTLASRDSVSGAFLAESFGRASHLATDMVFALPEAQVSHVRADVVLNVSGLLWEKNSHVSWTAYRTLVRDIIRGFNDGGRHVTLFAHVIDNPSPDNDVRALDQLSAEFPDLPLVVPETLTSAREFFASSALVVGSRMHACLNAISVGTPAIPLAYSRKFAPLFQDLGWSHTVDLRQAPDAQTVLAIASRSDLTTDLSSVLQCAQDRHQEFLASLSEVLR